MHPPLILVLTVSKEQFEDATHCQITRSKSNFFLTKRLLPAATRALLPAARIQPGIRLVRIYKGEERIPPKRRRVRTKPVQADDNHEDEKEKIRETRDEREGRVVLTDLGRCNFREDPLRRWAQLVGALTRPLSHPAFRPTVLSLTLPPSAVPLSSYDFTCEFNLLFS